MPPFLVLPAINSVGNEDVEVMLMVVGIRGDGGGDSARAPRRRRRNTRWSVNREAARRMAKMERPTDRPITRVMWWAEAA